MIAKNAYLFILILAGITKNLSSSRVGFAYSPLPDVIRCGGGFLYLLKSTPTLSTYTTFDVLIRYIEVRNGEI